ncbi:hypothetical protein P8452_17935 [Trifolium repens]|nr:hypothetical protein P8452_17935 [Trifolium repens]
MEHLPIHLPYEARVGGPVQYRWMYPFERFLHHLKKKPYNFSTGRNGDEEVFPDQNSGGISVDIDLPTTLVDSEGRFDEVSESDDDDHGLINDNVMIDNNIDDNEEYAEEEMMDNESDEDEGFSDQMGKLEIVLQVKVALYIHVVQYLWKRCGFFCLRSDVSKLRNGSWNLFYPLVWLSFVCRYIGCN